MNLRFQLYVIRVLFSRKATPRSGSPLRGASDSICFLSAVYVVVLAEHIHCLKKLMKIDKRSDNYYSTQNIPQPIIGSAETVSDLAALELIADTV